MSSPDLSNEVAERATSMFLRSPNHKPGMGKCSRCQQDVIAWDDAVRHAETCYEAKSPRRK